MYMHYNAQLRKALAHYMQAQARELVRRFDEGKTHVTREEAIEALRGLALDGDGVGRRAAELGGAGGAGDDEVTMRIVERLREAVGAGGSVAEERPRFKFVTTIHMATSCIIKLSSSMPRPASCKVYRGVGGVQLPTCFFKADGCGFRGGVEAAFMSTTLRQDVALCYSQDVALCYSQKTAVCPSSLSCRSGR